MKSGIHPEYKAIKVTCSCGNSFTTGSTLKTIQEDICSACHPFFTGEMRFVDVQGRVDKFMAKVKNAKAQQAQVKTRTAAKKDQEAKSYQQILREQKVALQQAKKATSAAN